ncbi:hypothetical protein [Stutzerimonas stutzeri]|nr:hypothetical protein [Stutzerimonas stutzeri]MCQ4319991.1 hypothetical protein [Stutzerimonas stutzeri]
MDLPTFRIYHFSPVANRQPYKAKRSKINDCFQRRQFGIMIASREVV